MSSSITVIGPWPRRLRSRFWCCSQVRSRSISTTTSRTWERNRVRALLTGPVLDTVLWNCDSVHPDPGIDRLLVQRLGAGECLGRLLNDLVYGAPAQPPDPQCCRTVA